MGLSRRGGNREPLSIWPGFVDAFTTLLLLLMFVLTIFLVVQFVLRDQINVQDTQLDDLAGQVASLADALGLERQSSNQLKDQVTSLGADLDGARQQADAQAALIATLNTRILTQQETLAQNAAAVASFEAQVASLLAERDQARGQVTELETARTALMTEKEALDLALASARSEIDAQAEAARLAAARRAAIDALLADLRARAAERDTELAQTQTELSDAEAARLVDAAAVAALRENLKNSTEELTAMTLALEEQRQRAEDTLTLLAAANQSAEGNLTEAERQAALLATATAKLGEAEAQSAEDARKVALLNEQLIALRGQLGALQAVIDETAARDADADVQIQALGSQLNSALATVAAEQRRRAELEEAERKRLEAEAKDLERYRSEFFGQLRDVLAGREGVRIVGDRFVFSSEVLFQPASADLAPEGRTQIAGVVRTLQEVAVAIPPEIDWMVRVDGHTDNTPLSGSGRFRNNWELSQARALAVVLFMTEELGFPPEHVAATGFGEYRPVDTADTAEARAANRRIELKLTER